MQTNDNVIAARTGWKKGKFLWAGTFVLCLLLSFFFIDDHCSVKSFFGRTNLPELQNQTVIVYRVGQDEIEYLQGIDEEKSTVQELGDSLILASGKYVYLGRVYTLEKEGLYRFIDPGKKNLQRIVYDSDIDSLLSALCWILTHGTADDTKSYEELMEKALDSKLCITCGPASKWACQVLSNLNIKARVVGGLTLDEWNDYDNGHRMIEVYRPEYGRWCCYDLDNNIEFFDDSLPLSLMQLNSRIKSGRYEVKFLACDSKIAIDRSSEFDYTFFFEGITANEQAIRNWYARVLQVPLIRAKDGFYFCDSVNRSRIEQYASSYKYITEEEFTEKFYDKDMVSHN